MVSPPPRLVYRLSSWWLFPFLCVCCLGLWDPSLGYSRFLLLTTIEPHHFPTHMFSTLCGLYEMSFIVPVVVKSVTCRKPQPPIFVPPTCQITVLVLASTFAHSLATDVWGFGLPPSFFGLCPIPCLRPILLDVWPLSCHPELSSTDLALP